MKLNTDKVRDVLENADRYYAAYHAAEYRAAHRPRIHAALPVRQHDVPERFRKRMADHAVFDLRFLYSRRHGQAFRREGGAVDGRETTLGHLADEDHRQPPYRSAKT